MLVSSFSIGLVIGLEPRRFPTQSAEGEQPVSNSSTTPLFTGRGKSSVMDSAHTDPELSQLPRWLSESANLPTFVPTFAEATHTDSLPARLL